MPARVHSLYAKVVTAEHDLEVGEQALYSCNGMGIGAPNQVQQAILTLWEDSVQARYALGKGLHW